MKTETRNAIIKSTSLGEGASDRGIFSLTLNGKEAVKDSADMRLTRGTKEKIES